MKACVVGLYVSLYCATLEHSLLCIKNWYAVKHVPHSSLTHLLLTTHSGWVREKAVSSHLIFEERSALFTWCEDHWRMTPSEDTSIVKQCITVLRPDTLCFLTGFPVLRLALSLLCWPILVWILLLNSFLNGWDGRYVMSHSLCGDGDQIQGSVHVRQAFCQLSHVPSSRCTFDHQERWWSQSLLSWSLW